MEHGHTQQLNPFECLLSAVNFVSSNGLSSPHSVSRHDFEVPQAAFRDTSPVSNYSGKSAESTSEDDEGDLSETEEEFCVPHIKSRKEGKQPAGKRSSNAHNEVEKRRRAYLTQCYNELHKTVPTIAGTKASNVVVLQSAADYIKSLEDEEQALITAKADLMRRREEQMRYRDQLLVHANFTYHGNATMQQSAMDAGEADDDMSASDASEYYSEDEDGVEVPDTDSRAASPSLTPRNDYSRLLHGPIESLKHGSASTKDSLLLLAVCGTNLVETTTPSRQKRGGRLPRPATKASSVPVKPVAAPHRVSRVSGRTIRARPTALQAY